ncbi:hypothetical protein LTR41_011677 [Exophiala xenobiotica]|nr:hypothetical protein LTR41_011677 [Exophiala xenobiotica]
MSSKPGVKDPSPDSSFWYDWDNKRGSYAQQENHAKHSIKATRVWRRLTSLPFAPSSGRIQQGVSPGRVNTLVKMVLAVANGHAFGALKEVMTFIQRDERATMAGVFSQDPKVLVNAVNSVDTADNLNCYLRRFALARLARLHADTVANRGRLGHDKDGTCLSLRTSTNKAYKAAAYVSLIQHIWDVGFPARFQGRNKTRSGLIDSDESDAVRWNHYKRKLSKQIEAGQRWLKFADKFGWSALGLVTRDWFIDENRVVANDRIFEEILAASEHGTLLDELESVKGRFLRQLNKTLGGSLFDLLEDSNRAQGLPLLKLDDHDILTRPDCDHEVGSGLLLVAGFALLIPSAFFSALRGSTTSSEGEGFTEVRLRNNTLKISQVTSIILIVAFLVYLWFNARSQESIFHEVLASDEERDTDRHRDLHKAKLTFTECVIALAISLTFVTLIAIFLVEEIRDVVQTGVPENFLGLILVPLVEKAAEHLTTVDEAYDNQMIILLNLCMNQELEEHRI